MTLKEAVECLTNPNVHEMILPPNQLTEWLTELKEAKRLLKAAVEDFRKMQNFICDCTGRCENCPIADDEGTCQNWQYEKEALKLLND